VSRHTVPPLSQEPKNKTGATLTADSGSPCDGGRALSAPLHHYFTSAQA
jgi:hypothetical protein